MTRAELLHRFRWVLVFLPMATIAGYGLLFLIARHVPSLLQPFTRSFGGFLNGPGLFIASLGWATMTLFCSARAGYLIAAQDARSSSSEVFIVTFLMALVFFVGNIVVAAFLLWSLWR